MVKISRGKENEKKKDLSDPEGPEPSQSGLIQTRLIP